MRGTQSASRRRRGLYPLLAGSWAAVALLSGGCIDEPKRASPLAGAAGIAGARGPSGGNGGVGGTGGAAAAGEAGVGADVGASGSSAEAGAGGISEAGGVGGDTGNAQAGSAGEAVEIDTFNEPCPSSVLEGWASVAGLDFDPSLSQPTPLEVTVSNATDLATYAASPDPYLIHVSGTIAVPVLDVKSNKTIVGSDGDATLEGGIRIAGTSTAAADMVSNVVIRNLRINAAGSLAVAEAATVSEADGISIAYAHHVWLDHVDVFDAPGENIDITRGSDFISVSWTKFRFTVQDDPKVRRFAARVGHSDDNSAEDSGRLKVTFHHNFWTGSAFQRMPRVRFGDVHVFDNYFSSKGGSSSPNTYCVAAAVNSRLLVENNYFDEVQKPHVFFSFVGGMSTDAEPTAQMVVSGNTYVGVADLPSGKQSGQGSAFTPPYSVALEPADTRLKGFMRHCTGPLAPTASPVDP